ncbi:hypothetical protein BH11PSE9_BH11PSE9_26710 [soil metagenome]
MSSAMAEATRMAALNITQLFSSNAASALSGAKGSTSTSAQSAAQTATQAAAGTSPASRALAKAEARIQSQLASANTQLSSFGKLKSSVSDAQVAAQALGGLSGASGASSAADMKTAATRFMTAFNAAITTARSTTGGSEAASDGSTAARVGNDMRRSLSATPSNLDSLRTLGFKQAADGTLTLDSAKFDAAQKAGPAAVQAALGRIGSAVDKTAASELATGGKVDGALASLTQKTTVLKTHHDALLAVEQKLEAAQSAASTSGTPGTSGTSGSSYVRYGLAAYGASS